MSSFLEGGILDFSLLNASADDKVSVTPMIGCVFEGLKTLWEKEKMLVTGIFSFSHDVFNPPTKSGTLKHRRVWPGV